jgi:methionyl-tRNA formyltransferase
MSRKIRIVYFGTPEFAVAPLAALLENKYEICAVVTATDKVAGRGHKISQSAVKQFAQSKGIEVLQPEKLKSQEFIDKLHSLQANLFIVVAFRMLPEVVWAMPALGTFNLHASLLPNYRGAAPINRAIMNGEKQTGLTTFFLQHEIDTGNIIFSENCAIEPTDNAGSLHDKLMQKGATLVLKTVQAIENNAVKTIPQQEVVVENCKHAPKIFKEDCLINWDKKAEEIHNQIRGLSPYPAAFTELNTIKGESISIKIFTSALTNIATEGQSGKMSIHSKKLYISCADNLLEIIALQLSGKKRMEAQEFINGFAALFIGK